MVVLSLCYIFVEKEEGERTLHLFRFPKMVVCVCVCLCVFVCVCVCLCVFVCVCVWPFFALSRRFPLFLPSLGVFSLNFGGAFESTETPIWAKVGLAKVGFGQNRFGQSRFGQSRSDKDGQSRFGQSRFRPFYLPGPSDVSNPSIRHEEITDAYCVCRAIFADLNVSDKDSCSKPSLTTFIHVELDDDSQVLGMSFVRE